jgi:hypothetical protein
MCKENELSELLSSRAPEYLERMRLIMKKKDPEYSMCPSCKADNRGIDLI